MQAGKLTERIAIEELIQGVDPIGQPVNEWRLLFDSWAEIRHLSGLEAIKAGAEASIVKASIRIRARTTRPRVKASMRVTHGGTVYNIEAVLPHQRRSYLDLICNTTGETE